jgi:hypothetical protein
MLPLESEKPRYTPRQDADRELPILVPTLYKKPREKAMITFKEERSPEIWGQIILNDMSLFLCLWRKDFNLSLI